MCGIAGWVDWETDLTMQSATLEAMTGTLSCNESDDYGMWLSRRAVFGHRLLGAVDPATGFQPMWCKGRQANAVTLCHGELYNRAELRQRLAGNGQTIAGASDAEVLFGTYLEWGIACAERLHGSFTFAIWDERSERLLLGRDRLGEKSLFYATRGNGLIFGSTRNVLLVHAAACMQGQAACRSHELRPAQLLIYDRQGYRVHSYDQSSA